MKRGHIEITLEETRLKKGVSRYFIVKNANISYTQLLRYIRGESERIDISVLERICCALDCDVCDLIRFVPDDKE